MGNFIILPILVNFFIFRVSIKRPRNLSFVIMSYSLMFQLFRNFVFLYLFNLNVSVSSIGIKASFSCHHGTI